MTKSTMETISAAVGTVATIKVAGVALKALENMGGSSSKRKKY